MEENRFIEEKQDVEILQLVCFKFAEEEYALEIRFVREVIHVQKITPVPQMPDFSLGVINIRGNIIPVFDFRRKFGLKEKPSDEKTKMVVAAVAGIQVCFVADEVLANIKVDPSFIVPAPNVRMKMKRECIAGIAKLDERMVIILDLEKIHESILEDIKALSSSSREPGE